LIDRTKAGEVVLEPGQVQHGMVCLICSLNSHASTRFALFLTSTMRDLSGTL
jgi:hypothetical protein